MSRLIRICSVCLLVFEFNIFKCSLTEFFFLFFAEATIVVCFLNLYFHFVFCRDKRPRLDIKNYMYDGLKDQTVGKLPGAIDGQQFIVQNCQVHVLQISVVRRNKYMFTSNPF